MKPTSSVSYIAVPMRLLRDPDISATAKLLYGLIEHHQMMSGGICYETNAALASVMCDCTPENISRCIGELKRAGYVEANYIAGYGRELHTCK